MKMNLLAIALIVAVSSIIFVYFYAENTRYYTTATGNRVYKIDRRTGKMWLIIGDREVPTNASDIDPQKVSREQQRKEIEKDAIQFAKYQRTLSDFNSNEEYIKNQLEAKKGHLRIRGWQAEANLEHKTAFVSFTWQDSSGVKGYFFECDMRLEFIRLINGDPDLEKKFGVEKLAFHEQISPETAKKLLKLLSEAKKRNQ